MPLSLTNHEGPWNAVDYHQLEPVGDRIELIDGSLVITPKAPAKYSRLARQVANKLDAGVTPNDKFFAYVRINVELAPSRILIPDFVVATASPDDEKEVTAEDVLIVGEMIAPGTSAIDRPQLYRAAGIPYYLVVDENGTLLLHHLADERYHVAKVARPGETLIYKADNFELTIAA